MRLSAARSQVSTKSGSIMASSKRELFILNVLLCARTTVINQPTIEVYWFFMNNGVGLRMEI